MANKNRNANGNDSTHWRIGFAGSTSSSSSAAPSVMRRAPQEGQKPRRLQLNATSFSAWHLTAHTQEAVLETPALEIRLEFLLHVVRQRPACGFARGDELGLVPLDELVEQRRLGPVSGVAGEIDERIR